MRGERWWRLKTEIIFFGNSIFFHTEIPSAVWYRVSCISGSTPISLSQMENRPKIRWLKNQQTSHMSSNFIDSAEYRGMEIYSDVPTLFRHESWIPVKLVESWKKCFILETRCHGSPEGWKYLIFNHFIEQFTKKK